MKLDAEAIERFRDGLARAQAAGLPEPTGMTLATVGADGRPSARTVLLKGATTLIASSHGVVTAVSAGPGWLATAGTGDVLAGVLGALTAANVGAPLADIAAAGVWLHGYAAALASGARDGRRGHPIVALDLAEALPAAIGELLS